MSEFHVGVVSDVRRNKSLLFTDEHFAHVGGTGSTNNNVYWWSFGGTWGTDDYVLDTVSRPPAATDSDRVYVGVEGYFMPSGAGTPIPQMRGGLQVGATMYLGLNYAIPYDTLCVSWFLKNPATGNDWTWSQIEGLTTIQLGLNNKNYLNTLDCNNVYLVVRHFPGSTTSSSCSSSSSSSSESG